MMKEDERGWVVLLKTPGEIVDPEERRLWEMVVEDSVQYDDGTQIAALSPVPPQWLFEALHDTEGKPIRAATIKIGRARVWAWTEMGYLEARRAAEEYGGSVRPAVVLAEPKTGALRALRIMTVVFKPRGWPMCELKG